MNALTLTWPVWKVTGPSLSYSFLMVVIFFLFCVLKLAEMYGYLNIEDCGNADTLTRKLTLKELRMINNWDYFIAAEEIVWDYAPEIPENIDK